MQLEAQKSIMQRTTKAPYVQNTVASAGFFASQRRVNLVSAIVVAVATLALLTYFAGSFGTAIALMGITQAASLAAAAFCQTLLPPST